MRASSALHAATAVGWLQAERVRRFHRDDQLRRLSYLENGTRVIVVDPFEGEVAVPTGDDGFAIAREPPLRA